MALGTEQYPEGVASPDGQWAPRAEGISFCDLFREHHASEVRRYAEIAGREVKLDGFTG